MPPKQSAHITLNSGGGSSIIASSAFQNLQTKSKIGETSPYGGQSTQITKGGQSIQNPTSLMNQEINSFLKRSESILNA